MSTVNYSKRNRMVVMILAFLVIAFMFLFGGSAMTALAVQSAIPGDALYQVKTTLEESRISLARSATARAELQLQFAERRLEETKSLITEGRYQNLKFANQQFETHIQSALAELEVIAAKDPAQAADLLNRITTSLARYTDLLDEQMAMLPDSARVDLQNSVNSLRKIRTKDSGNQNDNENTNHNANANTNTNVNGNANDNANSNTNSNTNGNSNANTNSNMNSNSNQNTNSNSNMNENSNSNTNDNRSDNSNNNNNHNDNDRNDNGNDDNDNDDDD